MKTDGTVSPVLARYLKVNIISLNLFVSPENCTNNTNLSFWPDPLTDNSVVAGGLSNILDIQGAEKSSLNLEYITQRFSFLRGMLTFRTGA